ncbi:MAG: P1 family peptidase, partial [Chloroflexota bacterium]
WDGYLNDVNGQHVRPEHVFAALGAASDGPVVEGSVGGGTGMKAFGFKAGIGTASRRVEVEHSRYTVGVLVQANMGRRERLAVDGVPVGREIPDRDPMAGCACPKCRLDHLDRGDRCATAAATVPSAGATVLPGTGTRGWRWRA